MARIEIAPDHRLLMAIVRQPERISSLSPQELAHVLDAASHARLLGWLLSRLEESPRPGSDPEWLSDRLADARALAAEYDRSLRWEIDRIGRAFSGLDLRWVLLKGAAYLAAGLPPGRGRRVADVDVLVPEDRLADAEQALREHGWEFGAIDAYDERYYREWMHELPPMVHRERRSVVDLHHAILPRTSRLKPSSARFIEQAIRTTDGVTVLSPPHMFLHASAHLFHDGEVAGALRDLVDLDALLSHFAGNATFWPSFLEEAQALRLERPAYYAVRYAIRLAGASVAAQTMAHVETWAPSGPARMLMDGLVERTLPGEFRPGSLVAAWALYVRSHWLRMSAGILSRHLVRKAVSRLSG